MSNYHCYLCASDDGIQLDIFGVGGKAICEKIESCLSVKIEPSNATATKICHKCVFELDACSKFLAKYKQSRDSTKGRSNSIRGHCRLCLEPGKIGYIFDCKDGNPANDTLHKIQEIFNDTVFNDKRRSLLICLDCRYNLDVLFDLKCIYQSTPDKLRHLREKGLQLSDLPKTKTRVVKRKTTFIPVPRLNGTEGDDTDSGSVTSIMPNKRARGRPRKNREPPPPSTFRTCEQCEINVENGLDMYRYHRTGITVCKECWLAMDPEKLTHKKRKKLGIAGGEVGTRRCAIILKDVLTNPAKYENIYKVEKDEYGNTTYIVTDDSSENEEREKTPAKRSRKVHESVASVDVLSVKRTRPPKRTASIKSTDLDDEPPAKMRDKGKNTESDSKPPVKIRDKSKNTESDSKPPGKIRDKDKNAEDNVRPAKIKDELKKNDEEKASTSTNIRKRNGLATSDTEVFELRTRHRSTRQSTDSEKNTKAASDAELTKPPAKKRETRTTLDSTKLADLSSNKTKTTATTKSRKTGKNAAPVVETPGMVERPVRRTRAHSLSSPDALLLPNRHSNVSRNAKSSPETESPTLKTRKTNTKSLSPKNTAKELEVENPYTCSVCHVEYRNKLIGMKHELTHAKQPEVKLQRVAIPEIIVEEAPAESSLIEEPEEQSHDVSSTSENRPGDSENVEKSDPVASHEEASIDVQAETNDNDENTDNLEKNKNLSQVVETTAEVHVKQEEKQERIEDETLGSKDENEDKVDDNENKDKDNVDEINNEIEGNTKETDIKNDCKTNETNDKNEDETEKLEDSNADQTEKPKDNNEDKTEETENKSVDNMEITENKSVDDMEITENKSVDDMEITEDRNEDKAQETHDKNDDKTEEKEEETENETIETDAKTNQIDEEIENKTDETEDKIKGQTEAPETTEAETTVDNEIVDEDNSENTRQVETNDTLTTTAEIDAADSLEPETTLNEDVDKEVKTAEPLEKLGEQVSDKSPETSGNLNGVALRDDANSEVDNDAEVEKDAVALNSSNAESEAVECYSREKSIESDNVPPVTSTSPEKNEEIQDVVEDKVSRDHDETINDLEADVKADTTETSIFPENNVTKDSEGSESIVSDVLTEVFDLATAEVQKRLDKEPSRDEKCTTPVSETLENISREISNSADMPSLEPLNENQSSKIQS